MVFEWWRQYLFGLVQAVSSFLVTGGEGGEKGWREGLVYRYHTTTITNIVGRKRPVFFLLAYVVFGDLFHS